MRWRFGSCARRAVVVGCVVVVGHAQATSHPIRSRSIGQGTSHRSGRVSSVRVRLICIKWERERVFCSAVSSFPIGVPSPNCYTLFLRLEKGEGFRPVLSPIPHLPPPFLFLLAVSVLESRGGF